MKNAFIILFLVSSLAACKAQTEKVIKLVDVTAFIEGLSNKDVQLVDVRTPAEFKEGYIENAILIDFKAEDFSSKMEELEKTNRCIYIVEAEKEADWRP